MDGTLFSVPSGRTVATTLKNINTLYVKFESDYMSGITHAMHIGNPMVYRHFAPETVQSQDTSAPVPSLWLAT